MYTINIKDTGVGTVEIEESEEDATENEKNTAFMMMHLFNSIYAAAVESETEEPAE